MDPPPTYASTYLLCPGVAGDIVAVQRNHCVHYVVNVGDNCVIHRTNPNVDRVDGAKVDGRALIVKEAFSSYARAGETWWVHNMFDHAWPSLPPAVIVARAHSKLGETGYSIVSENCEHFATWCRYDKAVSAQVDNALSTIANDVGTEAVATGAQFGAAGGRVGAAVGAAAGRVIGQVFGAVADQREADMAARGAAVPSGRCRQNEWANTGRAYGEKGVGLVGAVGAAAFGGLVGAIGGGARGVAKVADHHNVDRRNVTGIATQVVRASDNSAPQ